VAVAVNADKTKKRASPRFCLTSAGGTRGALYNAVTQEAPISAPNMARLKFAKLKHVTNGLRAVGAYATTAAGTLYQVICGIRSRVTE
jgi:hypothetical protein